MALNGIDKCACRARCAVAGLLLLAFAGCTSGPDSKSALGEPQPEPLSQDELANATYSGIYDEPTPLVGGAYEGPPYVAGGAARPRVLFLPQLITTGDLNADGVPESIVLLAESSGGSGSRTYLSVVARSASGPENLATALVGDRVQIRSLAVTGDIIELHVVGAGPEDPACCPAEKSVRRWQLSDGVLTEQPKTVVGTTSMADIAGSWRLVQLNRASTAPPLGEVTLTIDAGRISGRAGCNQYSGNITESGPGYVAIGPLITTRMACPDALMHTERKYLEALERVNQYDFLLGQLALTWQTPEIVGTLVFAAH